MYILLFGSGRKSLPSKTFPLKSVLFKIVFFGIVSVIPDSVLITISCSFSETISPINSLPSRVIISTCYLVESGSI